jgi:chemotaxis response regulator CheB
MHQREGVFALREAILRVLIVEDYEPMRRYIASKVRGQLDLQIVGEVADGTDAVQKAEELQPDLILMDVGLPTLDGIEATRRIQKVSPKSKILFVKIAPWILPRKLYAAEDLGTSSNPMQEGTCCRR